MAFRTQKISQMTPKGADLEATDLIEVSTIESGSYVTRSITGQELIDAIPPTTIEWGDIGGTLSDQTDLNTALNAKVPTSRTLTINGVTQDLSANRTFTISTGITIGSTAIASGTVGRILFEGAGNVVQESANLFWDATNNRLGIGTSTPTNALTLGAAVAASLQSSAATIFTSNENASNVFNQVAASNDPVQRPVFAGLKSRGTLLSPTAVVAGDACTTFLSSAFDGTAGQASAALSFDAESNASSGNAPQLISFITGTSGATRTTKMQVRSNGNVLINTTTDAGFRLDVNGTARTLGTSQIRSSSGSVLGSNLTTTAAAIFYNNGFSGVVGVGSYANSGGEIQSAQNGGLSVGGFLTLQRQGGNVLIGTATDAGFRLDVNGTARVKGTGATSATTAFTVQNSGGTTLMSVRDDSRIIMPVGGGGNVSIGSLNANTNAIDVRGYFSNGSNCGIYIENFNSGTIKTQLGGATNGILIDLTQSFSNGTRGGLGMVVTGTVNNTGTSIGSVAGYSFEPTITSLTGGSVLYAFNSTVGGAYINTSSRQSSSILQADSTTQGFLPPRMTTTQKNAIASPAAGLVVYDTTLNKLCVYTTAWETVTSL